MIKDYNNDVQTLFLRMMITNAELYTRVTNIMNSDNFDKRLRPAAEFIVEFSKKYGVMPEPEQIKATTGISIDPVPDFNEAHNEWFLEEFNMNDAGIVILDPVRVFSREIKEQVWMKQDKKCWVTGLPLAFEDAEGGHIVAHSNGGKSTIENCAIVHKNENSAMSSMDATMYKVMRQGQMAA